MADNDGKGLKMVRPRNVGRYQPEKKTPDWEQEEFESRSEIKKAAEAVKDMGIKISELTVNEIHSFNLPDKLLEAILLLKKMGKGPALKRQKSFIGKYLRQDEALIIKIKERYQAIEQKEQQRNAHFHRLEAWRDRLVDEGDSALTEFVSDYPQADRSLLRQLARNAKKEAEQVKPPKSARAMFKYLKGLEW